MAFLETLLFAKVLLNISTELLDTKLKVGKLEGSILSKLFSSNQRTLVGRYPIPHLVATGMRK